MQIYKVLIKNTDYSRGIDYTITSSTCNIFIKKELALKFAHDKANEFYKLYNEKNCNNEEPIYGINQYYLNFYDSTYDYSGWNFGFRFRLYFEINYNLKININKKFNLYYK